MAKKCTLKNVLMRLNEFSLLSSILNTDTLGYQLEKAGFLAAAPYLAMGTLLIVGGYFADLLQIKGYLTTTQVRRYFNCGGWLRPWIIIFILLFPSLRDCGWTILTLLLFHLIIISGFLAQTVFLMIAGYLMSPALTITFIIIAVALGAFAWCGFA